MDYNAYKIFMNKWLYKMNMKKTFTKYAGFMKGIFSSGSGNQLSRRYNYNEPKTVKEKVKWIDLKWNNLPGVASCESPIINHYPAQPNKRRLVKMKNDFMEAKI